MQSVEAHTKTTKTKKVKEPQDFTLSVPNSLEQHFLIFKSTHCRSELWHLTESDKLGVTFNTI